MITNASRQGEGRSGRSRSMAAPAADMRAYFWLRPFPRQRCISAQIRFARAYVMCRCRSGAGPVESLFVSISSIDNGNL
jgi:hypothetical protein